MSFDLRIEGAEKFAVLSKRLKTESKGFRKEVNKGLNKPVRGLVRDVRAAAMAKLPRRGGLAALIAGSRVNIRKLSAGIKLVGTSQHDIVNIDKGKVRHKTYGRRPWFNQRVPAGYWTETLGRGAPKVRKELIDVMDNVAKRVVKGL